MRLFLILLCSLILLQNFSAFSDERNWSKDQFDLDFPKMLFKQQATNVSFYRELRQANSSATLISGGYFTLGTVQGLSSSELDNLCSLTFGHPFAMTSFPLFKLNGTCGTPEAFFGLYTGSVEQNGDTLSLTYQNSNILEFQFLIALEKQGEIASIILKFKNLSDQTLQIQPALIFDAGLGRKGDGWCEVGKETVLTDSAIESTNLPAQLLLKERYATIEGLKLQAEWSETPVQKVIFANWRKLYENLSVDFEPVLNTKLYDLAIQFCWAEIQLAPGEKVTKKLSLQLIQPDFGNQLFMRWDFPGFQSIENGLPFPQPLVSPVEIASVSGAGFSGCQFSLTTPKEANFSDSWPQFNIYPPDYTYQNLTCTTEEVYKDKIVDLELKLHKNGVVYDKLFKRLFIPAINISDTGLVCRIDSLRTARFPEIKVFFDVLSQTTLKPVRTLVEKNIFLAENDKPIEPFKLERNYAGGSDKIDVVFVIDCSGSMGDDIEKVRKNVGEFCDSLKVQGFDFRLGLVFFSTTVDKVCDFTADVNLFKSNLTVNLWGGRENSLAAIYRGTELSFREGSKRTFIWITDEDYPVAPEINLTVQDVVNRLLSMDITIHSISLTSLQTNWSNPIIQPTGGNFYDINGNFRDILLDITHQKQLLGYCLTYSSPNLNSAVNQIKLEIHYAGRGGIAIKEYFRPGHQDMSRSKMLDCFPNPFNPSVQIQVSKPENAAASIDIFNILGQRVKSFRLNEAGTQCLVHWNAQDEQAKEVSAGNYFIQLTVFSNQGQLLRREMRRVLHLK